MRILNEGLRLTGNKGSKRVGFACRDQWGVAAELHDTTGPDYRKPDHEPFVVMRWNVAEGLAVLCLNRNDTPLSQ